MAKTLAGELMDMAWSLREEYNSTLERRAANRRSLRDLATQGLLTDEEIAQVAELYPERTRGEGTEATAPAAS